MAAEFLYGLMNNRKSMKDFAREEEAFEAAKRARKMAEEGAMLDLEQKKYDLEQAKSPQQPFKGSSWDAQAANVAYQRRLAEGLDPMTAEQMAVDDVLRSKVTFTKDAEGNTIAVPRSPMFGGGSPVPNQVSDYATPPFVEAPTMGTGDPLLAHASAYDKQVDMVGGSNPYARPLTPQEIEAVIGNQGTPASTAHSQDLPSMAYGGKSTYDLLKERSGVNPAAGTKTDVNMKEAVVNLSKFMAEKDYESQIKSAEEELKTGAANQKVRTVLNRMKQINDELKGMGAIVSSDMKYGDRIKTSAITTDIGQGIRKFDNPQAQALAEEYRSLQSTLLPYYASAAGLGSKSLDSEGERKSILQSFGSPSGIYESNSSQLKTLESLFSGSPSGVSAKGGSTNNDSGWSIRKLD